MRVTPINAIYETKFQSRRITRSFSDLVDHITKKAAVLDKAAY